MSYELERKIRQPTRENVVQFLFHSLLAVIARVNKSSNYQIAGQKKSLKKKNESRENLCACLSIMISS